MKTILIGAGDAGLECARRLKEEFLWISKDSYMTKKWLMPSMLLNYTEKKKDKLVVDVPRYIKKKGLNADFVVDEISNIDTKNKNLIGLNETYEYDKLVIATGAVPKKPKLEICEKEKILLFETFHDFIEVKEKLNKAKKVVIVGAGPIGFELSLRLASKYEVSIVEYDHDVLMLMLVNHPFYRYLARKMLKLRGVKLYLLSNACGLKENSMLCKKSDGKDFLIDCDMVIFSTGVKQNVPFIDDEGFSKERVLFCNDFGGAFIHERGGIRKKLEGIYAIGDAAYYLTKKNYPASAGFAEKSAKVAAFNVINGNKKKIRYYTSIYHRIFDTVLRRIVI